MEKYTIGSLICHKLYLRVFDFLTFILQGPHFCKHYSLALSKIGIFLYFRVRGKAQHLTPPSHFIGSLPPPPLGGSCIDNFRSLIGWSKLQVELPFSLIEHSIFKILWCTFYLQ